MRALLETLGAARERVILMPEGTDPERLRERGVWLAEICKEEGFRFSPRLHVDLWGNRRGVETRRAVGTDGTWYFLPVEPTTALWPIRSTGSIWPARASRAAGALRRRDGRTGERRTAGAADRATGATATEDELLLCHTPRVSPDGARDVESGAPYLSTGDTDITPNSWEAPRARRAEC